MMDLKFIIANMGSWPVYGLFSFQGEKKFCDFPHLQVCRITAILFFKVGLGLCGSTLCPDAIPHSALHTWWPFFPPFTL
jgi:hypothetical protein